jgi:hypothetical protein
MKYPLSTYRVLEHAYAAVNIEEALLPESRLSPGDATLTKRRATDCG